MFEDFLFRLAEISTLSSQFLVVLIGMAFVLCVLMAIGLELWALARRLFGNRDRMLPPREQTVSGRPWAIPANNLAEAHR